MVTSADRRSELRKHLLKPHWAPKKPPTPCTPLPTETELVAAFDACHSRQLEACQNFIALLHRFAPILIACLIRDRRLRYHDAEDAVASATAKTYGELLAGKCLPPLRTWYLKLRYRSRTFANLLRRQWAREKKSLADHEDGLEASPSYNPTLVPDFIDFIGHVAEGMTLKQRAILWAWVQGASPAEIAEFTKASRGSIDTAISRLRARLRLESPDIADKARRRKRA